MRWLRIACPILSWLRISVAASDRARRSVSGAAGCCAASLEDGFGSFGSGLDVGSAELMILAITLDTDISRLSANRPTRDGQWRSSVALVKSNTAGVEASGEVRLGRRTTRVGDGCTGRWGYRGHLPSASLDPL